jgi:hypothetical protein
MKPRIILLAVLLMSSTLLSAQTIMNIHQSNGTVLQIPLNTIDSITYTIPNPGNLATLTTTSASNVTTASATLGGNITADGGSTVTQRGVCYGTTTNPTTANSTTNDGSGTGVFSSNLAGLTASTTYYVRAYATNSAGTAYGNEVSFTTTAGGGGGGLAIGDSYQGGIIFYLDGLGGGLIAAPTDQSTGAEWGCYGALITGADGTAVGTGYQNTIDIEAGCTTSGTAADICANLTLGGYSDWFLPSIDELNLMWTNLADSDGDGTAIGSSDPNNLGGFAGTYYWSSTEDDNIDAWIQFFGDGEQFASDKGFFGNNVRAVRSF